MKGSNTKNKTSGNDLTKLLAPYASGWVALSRDGKRVLGAGETLQEAHDEVERVEPHPAAGAVYLKVIPPAKGYGASPVLAQGLDGF